MNLDPTQANIAHFGIYAVLILSSLACLIFSLYKIKQKHLLRAAKPVKAKANAKKTKASAKNSAKAEDAKDTKDVKAASDEINLLDLFRFMRAKLMVLLAVFSAVLLVGAGYGLCAKLSRYTATVSIALGASAEEPVTAADITLNNSLSAFYPELVTSHRVADRAKTDARLDVAVDTLIADTTVELGEDSNIVYISSSAARPELAQQYADALAQSFLKEISTSYGFSRLRVLDAANVSSTPTLEAELKDVFVFVFIGLILALGVVFIWFYFQG